MPSHVEGTASEVPNVYSDGTHTAPRYPSFALVGGAVIWKDRSAPLTEFEMQWTRSERRGPNTYTKLVLSNDGATPYRAELQSLLTAVLTPLPCHVCLDNIFVVKKANKFTQWAQQLSGEIKFGPNLSVEINAHDLHKFPGRPFHRTSDGDL